MGRQVDFMPLMIVLIPAPVIFSRDLVDGHYEKISISVQLKYDIV